MYHIQKSNNQIRQYSATKPVMNDSKNDLIVCVHAFYAQNIELCNSPEDDVILHNTLQVFNSYKNNTISM